MSKILILSPEIPFPVFKGNHSRIDQTILALIEDGHEVYLVALNSNQKNRTSISIQADLVNNYTGIFGVTIRRHPQLNKGWKNIIHKINLKFNNKNLISNESTCPKNFRNATQEVINKFDPDYIFVNYAKLTTAIPEKYKGIRIVDCHDIQSNIMAENHKLKGGELKYDIKSFKETEFNLLSSYDKIISININETKLIKIELPNSEIITIPAFSNIMPISRLTPEYDLLFVGSASPFNIEGIIKFVAKVMPIIRKKIPSITLAIAGDVSNCSAVSKITNKDVLRLGRVPNLADVYNKSKIVVSPILSGAGMKVKNIEALCFGMPIVATTFSMDGIDVEDKKSAFLADNWEEFAEAIISLLMDENLHKSVSNEALMLAINNYSSEAAKKSLRAIFPLPFQKNKENTNSIPTSISIKTNSTHRIKALIYATDAAFLIDYNIHLAKTFKELGVYSEFIKMDNKAIGKINEAGFLAHALRPNITADKRKKATKLINFDIKNRKFSGIYHNGIDLSQDFNIYYQMFPAQFEKNGPKSVVVHGILILEAIQSIINKIKPNFLVGWNGNGPHINFLMKVAAKINELPIFHIERGLLPNTIVFDDRGVNFKSSLAGSYLPIITKKERDTARKYIESYKLNSKTIITGSSRSGLTRTQILAKFNISERGYLFFPAQIESDSNIVINSPIYKKMHDVLLDLLRVADELNLYVICRPHPEGGTTLFPEHKRLIINSDIHLHDLLKSSVANIVINSTVGLESALLDRPTITLGFSVYSSKGATIDAFSYPQILNAIHKILEGDIESSERRVRTEELLTYIQSHSLLPIASLVQSITTAKNVLIRGGIVLSSNSNKPSLPKAVQQYQKAFFEFEKAIAGCSNIYVFNFFKKGTIQYFDGRTKPLIDDNIIKNFFQKKYGKVVSISIGNSKISTIESQLPSGAIAIILANESMPIKLDTNNVFVIDELFYPYPNI